MINHMVLGFAFSPIMEEVLLIHKLKPIWQKGKWNGIGGKIEDKEFAVDAMVREFVEETGIVTVAGDWKYFIKMKGTDWSVMCYTCILTPDQWESSRTKENECIAKISCNPLPLNIMPNLNWLIPMAQNALLDKDKELSHIEYM